MKIKLLLLTTLLLCSFAMWATPKKVACVGNSVTFGMTIENPTEKYPYRLQQMLGDAYEVRNFGHSGATLLKKGHRPYWNLPEFKEAVDYAADIVVIHLGLNDTDPRNWARYRDEFVRDYIDLIETFTKANPKAEVKICRMTPIFPWHSRFKSSTREWYWQVQEAIQLIAQIKNVELIDIFTPLHCRPDLFKDSIHPNGDGANIIAETIYGAINKDFGGLQLAAVFSDNMVLQRDKPIKFWGVANGGTEVKVEFNQETKSTIAQHDGKWQITFPALAYKQGESYTATIENETTTLQLKNILIGDVWLCSGQSNMEFKLRQSATAEQEIPQANYPNIRLYNMQPIAYTNKEAWDEETLQKINRQAYFITQKWQNCTAETASDFSAVAYHFGKKIHQETNVPIGLILNAVGGSPTEAWIDRLTLEHHPMLVDIFINWKKSDLAYDWCRQRAGENTGLSENELQRHPYQPSYLYETGIANLTNFAIAGAIWYQGESNEQNVELHEVLLLTLVQSWRGNWNENFPFYYVQLSSMEFGRPTWGHFRDSQRRLLSVIPNSGMAVSSDLGNPTDVHPKHKKQIGERLARWALYNNYGKKEITPSSPLFKSAEFKNGAALVHFRFAEDLHTSDGEALRAFEVAEYPGVFYPAKAEITEDGVRVGAEEVKNPRYVRYGWSSFSKGNLVNGDELPASTFTSEPLNWKKEKR